MDLSTANKIAELGKVLAERDRQLDLLRNQKLDCFTAVVVVKTPDLTTEAIGVQRHTMNHMGHAIRRMIEDDLLRRRNLIAIEIRKLGGTPPERKA